MNEAVTADYVDCTLCSETKLYRIYDRLTQHNRVQTIHNETQALVVDHILHVGRTLRGGEEWWLVPEVCELYKWFRLELQEVAKLHQEELRRYKHGRGSWA